ncbi:MYCBP-associated protein-like [Anthonomus grandis grandis]|uniref:MYCBP-associated protein-like n=1 Tax=Anthonomus grandis grandis TaxID=2921223 RepID=UPI002165B226|nr:MYCBP-associated protein-like [Anthonomus grandis grandis]
MSGNSPKESRTLCACLCGLKLKPQERDQTCKDHLLNWEIWMYRRRQMHNYLTRKLRRPPGDLLMNSGDTYRSVREEKLLLGYTKIETHFDKYRGNPEFWMLPVSLKSQVPPYKGSEYFKVKSYEERNEVPDITYVGVPDVLMDEKDIVPRTREFNRCWQNSCYRRAKVQQVSEILNEIQPHKPDISNLVILGSATPEILNTEKEPRVEVTEIIRKSDSRQLSPRISRDVINEWSEESEIDLIVRSKRFCLKINGHEFTEFSDYAYRENRITVIFEHFTDSRLPCVQTVSFENNGQTALRLYWDKYEKLKIFREYTRSTEIFHPFKFDRNEIVLLPGEKRDFQILFQVNHPGNFIEHWQLTTRPEIWRDDFKLIILLKGFSFIRNFDSRLQNIRDKLDRMIRDTAVRGILNNVLKDGNYCTPINMKHSFTYSEQEMFESANWIKSKTSNIFKYVYDVKTVGELKRFYEENRFPEDEKLWDFSVKKLREIARKRDLIAYFKNKVNQYETARVKREALQANTLDSSHNKATNSKQDKDVQKKSSKGQKEVAVESNIQLVEESYYNKLTTILDKLQRPCIYENKQRKKYTYCYVILKTYFCQMFDRLDSLSNMIENVDDGASVGEQTVASTFKAINDNIYNKPLISDRLTFEIFDESYVLKTKRLPASSHVPAKPKSLLLRSIPHSDVKKVYKAYFQKEEVNAQKKKTA